MQVAINEVEKAVLRMAVEDISRSQRALQASVQKSQDIFKSIVESRGIDPDKAKLVYTESGDLSIVVGNE